MRYSIQEDRYIFKDGADLLGDLVDFIRHIQSRLTHEGKSIEILETFYNTMVIIIGHADFESVIPNGTIVKLTIPTDSNYVFKVKKFDKVNRRYFITCKPKSFNGKSFGFWINSDFVKISIKNERKNSNV